MTEAVVFSDVSRLDEDVNILRYDERFGLGVFRQTERVRVSDDCKYYFVVLEIVKRRQPYKNADWEADGTTISEETLNCTPSTFESTINGRKAYWEAKYYTEVGYAQVFVRQVVPL